MLRSDAVPIRPERLMRELDAVLTPESLVVCGRELFADLGRELSDGRSAPGSAFSRGRGLAGLGWGLPAAIGAKVAHPEREVFCITGDGGFAHVWSELETAKRLGIKVTVHRAQQPDSRLPVARGRRALRRSHRCVPARAGRSCRHRARVRLRRHSRRGSVRARARAATRFTERCDGGHRRRDRSESVSADHAL